jgi:hypothetical protein
MAATTIDEVVAALDDVIVRMRARDNRLGYFAALYRKVTVAVRQGIAEGAFEDGPRMARLDVAFANRYLAALERHEAGRHATRAWQISFDAASSRWPIVLQHLLLGMNAHINLDLGIAAARTCPGQDLAPLRRDFDHINAILASLTAGVRDELTRIWPPLARLDRLAGDHDDTILDFSMQRARACAWQLAERLAPVPESGQREEIENTDGWVAALGGRLLRPRFATTAIALGAVRLSERGSCREIIDLLC